MATAAKKVNRITLGPTATDQGKEVALQEIATRLNQVIQAINTIIDELS